MTPSKLEDIEHAIEKAAAVALVEVRDDEIIVTDARHDLYRYVLQARQLFSANRKTHRRK